MKILWLLVLTFFSNNLYAQITLSDLLLIASENHPNYQNAKLEVEKAQLRYKAQMKAFLPSLSGRFQKSKSENSTDIGTNSFDRTELALQGELNLFNGFADKASLEIEDLNIKKAKTTLAQIASDINYGVSKSYYEYLYALDLVSMVEKIEKRRKQQMELLGLRFESGREDKGSYLQSKAKYLDAKFQVAQAKRELSEAKENLLLSLGKDDFDFSKITQKLTDLSPREVDLDIKRLDEIVKTIPSYLLSQFEIKIADEEITRTDAAFSPTLALSGSKGISGQDDTLDEDSWSVGITLRIPLFEGGSRVYNSKFSRRNKTFYEYKLRQNFNELRMKLLSIYNDYMDAKENLSVQDEYFKALSLRVEVVNSQYQNGLMTYTNWDLVQSEYINYEKSKLASLKTFLVLRSELDNVRGMGELR